MARRLVGVSAIGANAIGCAARGGVVRVDRADWRPVPPALRYVAWEPPRLSYLFFLNGVSAIRTANATTARARRSIGGNLAGVIYTAGGVVSAPQAERINTRWGLSRWLRRLSDNARRVGPSIGLSGKGLSRLASTNFCQIPYWPRGQIEVARQPCHHFLGSTTLCQSMG